MKRGLWPRFFIGGWSGEEGLDGRSDLFGLGVGGKGSGGREEPEGLVGGGEGGFEELLTTTGDIEHNDLIAGNTSIGNSADERSGSNRRSGMDVATLGLLEKCSSLTPLSVSGNENVAVGVLKSVVQPAGKAVRRAAVGENLSVDDLGIAPSVGLVVIGHLPRVDTPSVENRNEGSVLRDEQTAFSRAEAAVGKQAKVSLPSSDSTSTGTDSLEVKVGNFADRGRSREECCTHTVAASNVLSTALGEEFTRFQGKVTKVDGVEVIGTFLGCDQFDAGVERPVEPERIEVVGGNGEKERNAVIGANLSESAGGVTGGSDHEDARFVRGDAAANRVSLGLLERASGHSSAVFRVPTAESNIQVLKAEVGGEFFALIGDGSRGAGEHTVDRKPVGKFIKAERVGFGFELSLRVYGADERRGTAHLVLEHPTGIGKTAGSGYAFELVLGRGEIFHIVYDIRVLKSEGVNSLIIWSLSSALQIAIEGWWIPLNIVVLTIV